MKTEKRGFDSQSPWNYQFSPLMCLREILDGLTVTSPVYLLTWMYRPTDWLACLSRLHIPKSRMKIKSTNPNDYSNRINYQGTSTNNIFNQEILFAFTPRTPYSLAWKSVPKTSGPLLGSLPDIPPSLQEPKNGVSLRVSLHVPSLYQTITDQDRWRIARFAPICSPPKHHGRYLHFTSLRHSVSFFPLPRFLSPSKKALKTCKSKVRSIGYLGLTLSFQILYSILPVQEQGLKIGVNNTKCDGRIFNYSEYTKYIVPRAYQTRE